MLRIQNTKIQNMDTIRIRNTNTSFSLKHALFQLININGSALSRDPSKKEVILLSSSMYNWYYAIIMRNLTLHLNRPMKTFANTINGLS